MKIFAWPGVCIVAILALLAPIFTLAYEAAPIALTRQATFVTEKDAQLNGQGNPNGLADAMSWFEWGLSGSSVTYETPHRALPLRSGGNTLVNTSAKIIGLAPGTQYFYRLIVESGRGKDVGQTTYMTTKPRTDVIEALVLVETNTPGAVSESAAVLRGYVSPHGSTKTEAWFEWGETQRFEAQTSRKRVPGQAGSQEAKITSLTPGTTYFYRIVAENASGRVYGASRVFTTTGTPPPPKEAQISQSLPVISAKGDGVARTTTASGEKLSSRSSDSFNSGTNLAKPSGTFSNSGDSVNGFPGVSAGDLPGDIWSYFKKKTTASPEAGNQDTPGSTSGSAVTSSVNSQTASAASTGGLGMLWDYLTGKKKSTAVSVEKVGPKSAPAHTTVEYLVSYQYNESTPGEKAYLSVVLPETVVYIGDNTANELLVRGGVNGERIYDFPIGNIAEGSTRQFSILGMTTGDAKGIPDVRATLSYENASGVHIITNTDTVEPGRSETVNNTASVVSSSAGTEGDGWLPNSIIEWALYLVAIILSIVGIRKAREYYVARKEILMKEDEEGGPSSQLLGHNSPNDMPKAA